MRIPCVARLRNHIYFILIVPLVVLVMTWPTVARMFDGDEFWLHGGTPDRWLDFWNARHVERVLAGQADYYFSDAIFHPQGLSLAFQHIALPHALLFIAMQRVMPADAAYDALYLLMLCFNAFGGYVLIQHLTRDSLIATFGAVVIGISPHFMQGTTVPDIILIGTLPLALYYFHRCLTENRKRFALLGGICTGLSAFIGMYTFVITLLSFGIYGAFLAASRRRRAYFWRQLLLLAAVCGLISIFRVYPMLADASALDEALQGYHHDNLRSHDVLSFFVPTRNPFTEGFLRALFDFPPPKLVNNAYLGYLNLFLVGCALLHRRRRRQLIPWITLLAFFTILRLGSHLTVKGVEFTNIVLPERVLSDWFPPLFGAINWQEYYQPGVVIPLAVAASFGLAALLREKPARLRFAVVMLAIVVIGIEFYLPRGDKVLERNRIAYIDWLASAAEGPIKLINLPMEEHNPHYFLFLQTLTGYPHAFGFSSRNPQAPRRYINANLLLHRWDNSRSAHCLPHNQASFTAALDTLLDDGFTHIVLHRWLYGYNYIKHSFGSIDPAYDNVLVNVFRLSDLRESCGARHIEPAHLRHFARSTAVAPGQRTAIISFHPSERIDDGRFDFLQSLFSDWGSLTHLYFDGSDLATQTRDDAELDADAFARDNQLVYLVYKGGEGANSPKESIELLDRYDLCQRDVLEDGAVIEHYVIPEFSCALVAATSPTKAQYDNGARLENAVLKVAEDELDIQLMWSSLPGATHAISLQAFDETGVKALGQDFVIEHLSLARHRIDITSLAPGSYAVKLILYNFNSGASVPGTASGSGQRFDRELELATIQTS